MVRNEATRYINPASAGLMYERPVACPLLSCSSLLLYQRELEQHAFTQMKLEAALARECALVEQKSNLIKQKDVLSLESEHRLLNGLQLVASLLLMNGRSSQNAEVSRQLELAAMRVGTIGRVHRHLHALDDLERVRFAQFLKTLSTELALIADADADGTHVDVESQELELPKTIAIPLGFIASELITNSIKHAKGHVLVSLLATGASSGVLSVTDDGPGLPENFDLDKTKRFGLKLVIALVKQINGVLTIGNGPGGRGACFAISFSINE